MNYYGTRLSENLSIREPEGYLLCLNVPVARTGYQNYWPEELGLESGSELIKVYRPEEEVFSTETMASFEGMPVTDDHPEEGVDVQNNHALQRGHAQNIRRGKDKDSDLLIADLLITDPRLIRKIMNEGKREISCGYTYTMDFENGEYIQRQIRGNHVAVVDAGRAGHRVCIKDHSPNAERSKPNMKKSLMKFLARMAKDGDVEAVAEFIEEMLEPEAETPVEAAVEAVAEEVAPVAAATAAVEEPAAVVETPEATIVVDEDTISEVISRLDRLIELLTPAAPAEDEDPVEEIAEAVEEALEAAAAEESPAAEEVLPEGAEEIAEVIEEIVSPMGEEPELALEDECGDPDDGEVLVTGDALRAALRSVQPALAKLPKKQRQKACKDIAARLKKSSAKKGKDSMSSLRSVKRPPSARNDDLGKRIMERRNVNYKK